MKILIVEDAEERISWFKNKFKNDDLLVVSTAQDAIDTLTKSLDFDYVFLDHDLGCESFDRNKFNERSGTHVAKFLNNKQFNGKIVIHSMNYYGTQSMKSYLPNAIICPFPFLR